MTDDLDRLEQEERARAEAERKKALQRQQQEKDLRELLALPAGRRVLWHLIDGRCGLHSGSFSEDALWMAHHEGRRAIGREVLQDLQSADRDGYLLMLTEQLPKDSE